MSLLPSYLPDDPLAAAQQKAGQKLSSLLPSYLTRPVVAAQQKLMSQNKTPVLVRPQRSIGGLYPDVTIEEKHTDDLEITEHPVEQGAAVHDHAFKKPEAVSIRSGVTDAKKSGGERPSQEFYDKLLELQAKREPFDIITGKRKYKNMLIKSLFALSDPENENCLIFTAECQEVIIVATQVTSVPPRAKQANPAKTGATGDKGQVQAQRTSALGSAAGGGSYSRAGGAAPGYGGG